MEGSHACIYFYPRPPRGGRRATGTTLEASISLFLSTPSARRATVGSPSGWHLSSNFYPRPPRGGRPSSPGCQEPEKLFLSTPSARRATGRTNPKKHRQRHFYPRPPRGGRHLRPRITGFVLCEFLSTPSARRATETLARPCREVCISIHALREEGDDVREKKARWRG